MNPTPEQQNEPGYTTRYTEEGAWWTLDGIDWYPLVEEYHSPGLSSKGDENGKAQT